MKLLWENEDTTASFAAQTITLDEEYDYIVLQCRSNTTNKISQSELIPAGSLTYNMPLFNISTSSLVIGIRDVTFDGTNVTFSSGVVTTITVSSHSQSTDNTRCIPVAIYGGKLS